MKKCFLILLSLVLFQISCKDDEGGGSDIDCATRIVTYNSDIKAIVDRSCAYVGCHNRTAPTNSPHDYTTYAGMQIVLENGKLNERVLQKMDMPDRDSVPNGRPERLTDEEKDLIECWLQDGYPEG